MRERDVESYFVEQVKAAGGEVRKVKWVNKRGAPDRVAMLNGAHFVELKRPGGEPEPHQLREHERMRKHGLNVHVIDTFEGVDCFIREVTK
jgi:hypothetical protein